MSGFLTLPLLWAQAGAAAPARPPAGAAPVLNIPPQWIPALKWLYLSGDPTFTTNDLFGGFLTWLKAVSLLCLIAWIVSWLVIGVKERVVGQGRWYDYIGVLALLLTPVSVLLRVLESVHRIPVYTVMGTHLTAYTALACVLAYLIWIEIAIGRTIKKLGRPLDVAVLIGVHLALVFGMAAGVILQRIGFLALIMGAGPNVQISTLQGLIYGVRMSGTFMGYIVFARIAIRCLNELWGVRGRRLYSIGVLSWHEANRRMWAPWVVLTVFLLVLAFTHWFLQPPRAAEMGRLYVGTLSLLCSILLTVMITVLAPLSLPTDIQQQTIYTVVSKPTRRLELIWGRMLGYMALVTVLMLVFGGISLAYLWKTVYTTIETTEAQALKAKKENRLTEAKLLTEQAQQLRTRMQARYPVMGSLAFLDSRGTPHAMGIDVGQDQSMRQPRSHIEGATPSAAIWSFGVVPDPFTRPGQPPIPLDRRIPVSSFLQEGTIESALDRVYALQMQIDADKQAKTQANLPASRVSQLDAAITRNQAELDRLRAEYDSLRKRADDFLAQSAKAQQAGHLDEARQLKLEATKLSSPDLLVEMSFNVYRTTKGKVGEPVYAEITAVNPRTGREYLGDVFAVKEYYTNRAKLPAWLLAGSNGALRIEIRCMTPTQYLGMAESDLYLLLPPGNFGFNYMKGLFGIWLQAMVLTAIGVCAGTFLSWPVALLTTIFFFVAGELAFAFLVDFSRQAIMGGGPFESLIRLVTHDNQMSDLTPTAGVVLAKTLDSLVMPLMSMIVYLVPNFQALDVTNMVADGFAVSWRLMGVNTLLALAYAVPFSLAGYLILKNREVAA